jgi:WD40 repeat protein
MVKPFGQLAIAPVRHDAAVYSAQFSPYGLRVVTASFDTTARVWDARIFLQPADDGNPLDWERPIDLRTLILVRVAPSLLHVGVSSATVCGFAFATLVDSERSRSRLNSCTVSDLPSTGFFFAPGEFTRRLRHFGHRYGATAGLPRVPVSGTMFAMNPQPLKDAE